MALLTDRSLPELAGRRVLITGAARGLGAALAQRLASRGARVAVAGLEPELLEQVAGGCGGPWWPCDVADRARVDEVVGAAASALGGLDVIVANAGIAAQLPIDGGDPSVFERTVQVNLLGTYYTLRAAAPHISHRGGYAVAVSSLAAAVHLPLLGAYSASKAATEALGNTLRIELRPSGARVGVAYFSELDTDMTSRGFGTEAAAAMKRGPAAAFLKVRPAELGISALERGIARRSKRIVAPGLMTPVLPLRMFAQPIVDLVSQSGLRSALDIARRERVELTTPQPERPHR